MRLSVSRTLQSGIRGEGGKIQWMSDATLNYIPRSDSAKVSESQKQIHNGLEARVCLWPVGHVNRKSEQAGHICKCS